MSDALSPGSRIGILGGGQLGRMLVMASARLGFDTVVLDPDPSAPAGPMSNLHIVGAYDSDTCLDEFADAVTIVTYEFENIPVAALDRIESKVAIRPGRNALAVSQDRLDEKTWLHELGLPVAPFEAVGTPGDLAAALAKVGYPAILKTRRFGYDGKGQVRIAGPEDAASAIDALQGAPAIVEGVVNFQCEISVIVARSASGKVACYDPGENVHLDGILRTTRVPAAIDDETAELAKDIAGRIVEALDYVGVMGVEMFVVAGGGLTVNEIAPRVHNSGHWTELGAAVDQFEQHIRAIAGLPLAAPTRIADVEMTNLIGSDVDAVPDLLTEDGLKMHLYGKADVRDGRKMGHVTRVLPHR